MNQYINLAGLFEKIALQQQGNENKPEFMIGEQLKEIAEREPVAASIIDNDIEIEGMKLSDAADALKKYSDKNRGKEKVFCITPKVAENILRDFYKIPAAEERPEPEEQKESFIDLANFL